MTFIKCFIDTNKMVNTLGSSTKTIVPVRPMVLSMSVPTVRGPNRVREQHQRAALPVLWGPRVALLRHDLALQSLCCPPPRHSDQNRRGEIASPGQHPACALQHYYLPKAAAQPQQTSTQQPLYRHGSQAAVPVRVQHEPAQGARFVYGADAEAGSPMERPGEVLPPAAGLPRGAGPRPHGGQDEAAAGAEEDTAPPVQGGERGALHQGHTHR